MAIAASAAACWSILLTRGMFFFSMDAVAARPARPVFPVFMAELIAVPVSGVLLPEFPLEFPLSAALALLLPVALPLVLSPPVVFPLPSVLAPPVVFPLPLPVVLPVYKQTRLSIIK